MNQNAHILVVEDEEKISRMLSQFLQAEGYRCQVLARGDQVLDWLQDNPTDLILLDLMLPGMDGTEVCKAVRKTSTVPIIMLTARVEEVDQLRGLELGADDYITKPFSLKNVSARVAANLRRVQFANPIESSDDIYLSEDKNELNFHGTAIELTHTQYRIMEILLSHPGRIFSRGQLLDMIHSDKYVTERTIDTHIKTIRKKLNEIEPERALIHSVYAMGYKWEG